MVEVCYVEAKQYEKKRFLNETLMLLATATSNRGR